MQTLDHGSYVSSSEAAEQIRAQLNRILKTNLFSVSKRYGPLLKLLVEHALENGSIPLKERTIGNEIFGRSPNYDTGSDPIVRVAIGEVRKRLAQYYHENAQPDEMHIEIFPGSYQPKFTFPGKDEPKTDLTSIAPHLSDREQLQNGAIDIAAVPELPAAAEPASQALATPMRAWLGPIAALVFLGLIATIAIPWSKHFRPTAKERAIDEFWEPVIAHQKELAMVIGNPYQSSDQPFDPNVISPLPFHLNPDASVLDHLRQLGTANLDDVAALIKISQFVGDRVASLRLFSDSSAELADLKEEPAILLGGLDNNWTLMTTRNLRFHIERDPSSDQRFYIADNQNPSNRSWGLALDKPFSESTRDYALVARLHSSDTGQETIVLCGLGGNGTIAAAEFLTNPTMMEAARKSMNLSSWNNRDFEIVLQIDSIGDTPTPPRIVASATL